MDLAEPSTNGIITPVVPNNEIFDPFQHPDASLLSDFVSWYVSAKAGYICGSMRVPLQFTGVLDVNMFDRIINPTAWLSNTNQDMLINLLMYRASANPQLFLNRWAVVDHLAWTRMSDPDHESAWPRMEGYVRGDWPRQRPMPWASVDFVFGVAHLTEGHWVAYQVIFAEEKIVVYDSLNRDWERVKLAFSNISRFLPWVCNREGIMEAQGRCQSSRDEWEVVAYPDSPQQNNCHDCGIMAMKYIECLASGVPVEVIPVDECGNFRDEYLVQFWKLKE